MNVITQIIHACESGEANPILNFGGFCIDKKLGNGQQGIVLRVKNVINKQFALKFYQPTDKSANILKESIPRFIKEVNTLAELNHKNIVKIYTGGFASWNESSKKWAVTEGFQTPKLENLEESEVYYYIMDYIEGDDLAQIYPELAKSGEEKKNGKLSISEKIQKFEMLIQQVSEAMSYYHKKGIVHKDIKPENIRFSITDSTFIIVDFGFSHHTTSPQNEEQFPKVDIMDLKSIENNNYEKHDMFQFCKMLGNLLPTFKDEYHANRYTGLESSLKKGMNPDLDERYKDMEDFYYTIKQYFLNEGGWRFQLKVDEFMTSDGFGRFDSKLRIPLSGSILLSKELREIIDTPEFQRLRGVRQLGPTMFVFPGANHTRFEHSLGVYALSLRYLEKILSLSEFRRLCEPIGIGYSIKLVVLSSLLHDIGHYPYSHWIEEIDELPGGAKHLPRHEKRASNILQSGKIKSVIEEGWKVSIKDIADLIENKSKNELLNSIINSVIDVDKLDYLIRDSIHCGVDYGKGIDIERLLDSLYVNSETNKLCVTEKGRSALLSILSTRNIMYQEVYWHKTVRACEAMFKRFFFEYIAIEEENIENLEKIFCCSDDEFTTKLSKWASNRDEILQGLIQPFAYNGRRNIYKPAYIYFDRNSKETNITNSFFRGLFNKSYKELIKTSDRLSEALKQYIPDIKPFEIILEKTPIKTEGEKYMLDGFKIFNTRKQNYNDHPKEIEDLNEYLSNNKQAYIFCHPRLYDKIRELSLDSNNKLQNILAEM
ncbi:MAG: protein kinase [Treponema sp.]|jgi:HD superfamily phosphohydrolase/tRNA A-37 threonylcarbamoyl transferase component Bud32|nr:protein kinase [Treponema sp.]